MTRCPTYSTIASTIPAFTSATPMAVAIAPLESVSAGISTSSGITARSWKSSTPITWRPKSLCSWARSASVFDTIAVEDIAATPPSTSPALQSAPAAIAAPMPSARITATWAPPNPNTMRRIAVSCGRLNSRPTENMRNTTPNSAR